MDEKVKELAAWYNTWGYDSCFSRIAEKQLVNDNKKKIEEARSLAAMARDLL